MAMTSAAYVFVLPALTKSLSLLRCGFARSLSHRLACCEGLQKKAELIEACLRAQPAKCVFRPNRHPFRWQIGTGSDANRQPLRSKSAPLFRVS